MRKKFFLKDSVEKLSLSQMNSIMGSSSNKSYHYFLRCNQDSPDGIDVNDCSNTTAEQYCGRNANWVCIETYY